MRRLTGAPVFAENFGQAGMRLSQLASPFALHVACCAVYSAAVLRCHPCKGSLIHCALCTVHGLLCLWLCACCRAPAACTAVHPPESTESSEQAGEQAAPLLRGSLAMARHK
eukprot:SAG25_NODE_217_length_11656_cov_91.443108_9_plen_112_part_00